MDERTRASQIAKKRKGASRKCDACRSMERLPAIEADSTATVVRAESQPTRGAHKRKVTCICLRKFQKSENHREAISNANNILGKRWRYDRVIELGIYRINETST